LAVAKGNAIGDQGRQVGCAKADAWRGLAVVLDVRRFVQVVGKGLGQFRVLGMGLRVVPADTPHVSKNYVAIVTDSASDKVNSLAHT
jgi:hypothetical protein